MAGAPISTAPPGVDRREVILRGIDPATSSGLEIGPSLNPIVPKSGGTRIESVDHTDADSLRAKYGPHVGVDISRIEDVDHIWAGGRLRDAVPGDATFDYVIASHVLEHLPNPIAFLQDCSRLLRAGGTLALALPDHRFCFDHLRPPTTFGQWVDAYDGDRKLHTPGTVVDHLLHATQRNGAIAWDAANTLPLGFVHDYPESISALAQARAQADYLDVHAWVFNPHSFAALVEMARRFELIDLELVDLVDTVGSEFFATFRRPRCTGDQPASATETADDEAARLARLSSSRATERAPDVSDQAALPRPLAHRAYRMARRLAGRLRRAARRVGDRLAAR